MKYLGFLFLLVGFVDNVASAIQVDLAVPEGQARSLKLDQVFLGGLQFNNDELSEATRQLLKIKEPLNSLALQKWLDARVSVILSEATPLEKVVFAAPGQALYPEPQVLPLVDSPQVEPEKPPVTEKPSVEPVLIMSNVGAALYLVGKKNGILLGIRKTNGEILPLVSPRSGVIQIGRGLFHERFNVNQEAQDHPANSISRISTLFHESRHSDGHGPSLGFLHAICPAAHPYAGHAACDKNLNGPYTVGAQVLSLLVSACGDCSLKEKTILKLIEADSRSRVLRTYAGQGGREMLAVSWSDHHEEVLSFVPKREL